MKPDCNNPRLVSLVILLASISCTPVFSARVSLPLQVNNRLATISVTVNGQGPYRFLIDTGTEGSLIDGNLARELGLRPTHRIELATMAGLDVLPVSPATLGLGTSEIGAVDFIWMESGAVKRRIQPDGVIGQNVLSRFNYLLDYQHRALTLQDRSEEIMGLRGGALPCRKGSSRCEITVPVGVNGRPTSSAAKLVLDSGADAFTLVSERAKEFERAMTRDALEEARMFTHSGFSNGVLSGVAQRLMVAGRTMMSASIVLVKTGIAGERGDGLLPTSLFESVYFSNGQGTVLLNPGH